MKKVKNTMCAFIVMMLLMPVSGFAADLGNKVLGVDKQMIDTAMKGKALAFNRQYEDAMQLFKDMEKSYPDSATGLFGQMAVWQIRMFVNEDFKYKKEYEKVEKKFKKFETRMLRVGRVPPWELFVYGGADGMLGFFQGRQGKWLKALSNGLHSMRMFKRLKWEAPDFIDTDLGFGMYKYWRSAFTNEIKFLPFFGDHRNDGIALVKKVSEKGDYTRDIALANLVFIYNHSKKYKEALSIADRIIAMYPRNLLMRNMKGQIYYGMKKYDQALAEFKYVYSQDPSLTSMLVYQGKMLFKKEKYEKAKELLKKYVAENNDKYWLGVSYYWLGMIAEEQNDKDGAKAYYQKSLENYKFDAVKKRLSKLD